MPAVLPEKQEIDRMRLHVRRYLYRANLYLKLALKSLVAYRTPSASPRPGDELPVVSRFFFIVVEVREEDKALIRMMQVNPSVAAAIQLPDGCQFRTCFEISAEYANVVIKM